MKTARARIALMVLLIVSGYFLGCEEMVDPANTTEEAFTLYGVINPTLDRQALRVFPIEDLLEVTRPEPIDARVFSADMDTGEMLEWQDSLVYYEEGSYGHVFWSPFRAEFDHTYNLEVVRSDGVGAKVTTTVPPFTESLVEEPDSLDFDLEATVFWPNAPSLVDIQVEYISNVGVYRVHYGSLSSPVEGGREVTVSFRADTRIILADARISRVSPVMIQGVVIRAVVASSDWISPGVFFDPDVLVEPGTLSNVEDGFGFVGSGYETATFWMPTDAVLRHAGFATNE